jgi:ADP-ribosylglycohydrolase
MDGLSESLKIANHEENLRLHDIIDYEIIMENFSAWLNDGQFTPYGYAYDIGGATRDGIRRYDNGCEPLKSGGIGERDNGNGSLMRILPIAFYIYYLSQRYLFDDVEKMGAAHDLSSLTHRHKRSQIACGIYVRIALEFIENHEKELNLTLEELIENGIKKSKEYYQNLNSFKEELHHFDRVFSLDIQNLPRDEIKSGGYCISSLEASIWCLLNNENYKDTVLAAVNLGYDTDTTACIVGGLAGIYYGFEEIPSDWIEELAKLDYIYDIVNEFSNTLNTLN